MGPDNTQRQHLQQQDELKYDLFTHLESLRAEGNSWRTIGKIVGKDHGNLFKYHQKQKKIRYSQPTSKLAAGDTDTSADTLLKRKHVYQILSLSDRKKQNDRKYKHKHKQLEAKSKTKAYVNVTHPNTNTNTTGFPLSPSKSKSAGAVISRYGVEELPRLPKYGKLPPTGYISDLSDDDWINLYGGPAYTWEIEYLTELREYLSRTNKGIVYEPRGHGKTKTTIPLKLRRIVELHKTVMVLCSGPNAKKKLFKEFKRIATSDVFRRDYGDIFESFSQLSGDADFIGPLKTKIDPALKVAGRGEDVIGSHPDDIHLEDIIQEEFKSDESNESLLDWFSDVVNMCANEDTKFTATATRKGPDDFYGWLVVTYFWEVLHKRAIELVSGRWPTVDDLIKEAYEDGSGLIKERLVGIKETGVFKTLNCPNWSTQRLLIARTLEPKSFESQMQNNPLPAEGLYFNANDFIIIKANQYNNEDYKDYYIFIDSAYGQSNKADNTSIMVVCVIPPKLVIVDGIIDRLTWTELEAWIRRYKDRYNPHIIYIEENTWQIWLKQATIARGWPIMGIKQKKNKILRISATKVHWIEKRIEILNTYPGRDKLYAEYVQYDEKPSTTSKHDDGLDTVAMACEHLAQYVRTSGISWYN